MSDTPASILFSSDGYEVTVSENDSSDNSVRALPSAGSDGSNMHIFRVSSDGTVRIDPTGITSQPISGSVTANIGNTGNLALDTTLTGGNQLVKIFDGTNIIGTSSHPIKVDPTGTTIQPVSGTVTVSSISSLISISGTVTANIGTTNGLALDSTLTSGSQRTKITDGTNNVTILGSTPIGTENALIVRNIPSGTQVISGTTTSNIGTTGGLALDTTLTSGALKAQIFDGTNILGTASHPIRIDTVGTTTQPVSGAVTANAGSGNFTVIQTTAANLNATIVGTVTSNIGATNGLALDATITGGNQVSKISDGVNIIGTQTHPVKVDPTGTTTQPISGTITANAGSGTFSVSGTVTSNIGSTNGLSLDTSVNGILRAQGSSTSGQTGPLIQGAVTASAPAYVTTQTSPLSLTTAGALRVDNSAVTQPVSGTVTANAGSGTFAVSGTVTANVGTTNGLALDNTFTSGSAKFQQYDGINVIGTLTHPVRMDPTGTTTQPVSGTITSNIGTTGGLALDSSLNTIDTDLKSTQPRDITDRAARLLGVVYGSQGQKIQQTAINYNAQVEIAVGATLIDPRSIRLLTSSDVVTANAGSGTFTVGGTVTSNIGLTNGLALDATLTSGGAKFQQYDGVNVIGTSSHPVRTDPTGITTQPISGTITANAGSGTFSISGTVTSNQGGVWTVQPGNTANTTPWLATINQGGNSVTVTASNALKVDNSSVTQPVSGTITANAGSGTFAVNGTVTSNIGTTNGLSLDATVAKLTIAQNAVLDSNTQVMVGGSVTTSAPTYTAGNINPLSLTVAGALRIDGSGTTQPISGTITSNQGGTWTVQPGNTANTTPWLSTINQGGNSATVTASNALKVDGSAVTQPVSGTITANAGSGTFTVSGTTTSNQGTSNTLANAWASKITDTTNGPVAVKAASTAPVATDPSLVVSVSPNSLVTKATQPANFLPTQNSIDSGRVVKVFQVSAVAGVTTEGMVTLTPLSDFTAGATGTSFTVTSGKRLRLQALVASVRATTTTAVGATIRLRISASGAVTTSTPAIASIGVYESVAVANNAFSNWISLPDGLELSGTMQLGISQLATATSASLDIQLIGFEY